MERAENILRTIFGYDRFISLQEDVIESVLSGRDCLAVMPTGGGKSLCYQIPALIFEGLTIVVSPLIALMKDQVEQLLQVEIPAVLLNSAISPQTYRQGVERVRGGEAKLLYAAPETLLKPEMLALLDSVTVSCLAIDEAHCISEWGPDFRPEYRQLASVRARMPHAACIALTATATPRVRKDIKSSLGFADSSEFVASFNRENLLIRVVPKERPLHQVIDLLSGYPKDSGIIYCSTRKEVDDLCSTLQLKGFSVCPYHAGLSDAERSRNQERFVRDEVRIVVATIAFGMGIDKSNIRFVLHYSLPKNIESYYQEIGRAGRDGMEAECVLLFSYADIRKIKYFVTQKEGMERRAADLQLSAMLRFAESEDCRRVPLLGYFGESFDRGKCDMCDNCLAGARPTTDMTVHAQKFLSCVKRTGERFGIAHIIDVLRGSKAAKVLKFGHERLSTYGIGKDLTKRQWQQVARQLLHKGLMIQDPEIGGLSLTAGSWDVFRGKTLVLGRLEESGPEKVGQGHAEGGDATYDREIFEALRRKRKELADAAGVPPYVIFSDKTLAEMAANLPRTPEEMLRIHGVGNAKLDRYGSTFLTVLEGHSRNRSGEEEPVVPSSGARQKRGSTREMREFLAGEAFNAGRTLEELAQGFGVKESTVLEYLYGYCLAGNPLRSEGLLPRISLDRHRLKEVMKAFGALGSHLLKPVFDALNGAVDYGDLKLLRLYYLGLGNPSTSLSKGAPGTQPHVKRIVCLANSRKFSGRCIAGKEVSGGRVGAWIRPVRGEGTGELSLQDILLPHGKTPGLLDILAVPLQAASPKTYQSENHLVAPGIWKGEGSWGISRAGELCDQVDLLWINGFHSQGGQNDKVPLELAEKEISSSLLFIRPEDLAIVVEQGSRGLNRVRAWFSFKGEKYGLPVTDPAIEAAYLSRSCGSYPVGGSHPHMTVSLGEPFEGFCYKLAAALIQ